MCYAYYAVFSCSSFGEFGNFFFIIIIYRVHFRRGIVLCTLSVMMMLMVGRWNIIIWEREYAKEKCVYAKKCANLFNVYEGYKEWGKLALNNTEFFGFMRKDRYGKWLLLRCSYFCSLQNGSKMLFCLLCYIW